MEVRVINRERGSAQRIRAGGESEWTSLRTYWVLSCPWWQQSTLWLTCNWRITASALRKEGWLSPSTPLTSLGSVGTASGWPQAEPLECHSGGCVSHRQQGESHTAARVKKSASAALGDLLKIMSWQMTEGKEFKRVGNKVSGTIWIIKRCFIPFYFTACRRSIIPCRKSKLRWKVWSN